MGVMEKRGSGEINNFHWEGERMPDETMYTQGVTSLGGIALVRGK